MKNFINVLALFALTLGFGCSSPKTKNPEYKKINGPEAVIKRTHVQSDIKPIKEIPQFENTKEHMAPGHLFSIYHPSDEKIRGSYRVNFDGILRLPYGIQVNVIGLDFQTLRKNVLDGYKSFFQRGSEDVTFLLLKRDYWVEVGGFVKKSGHYLVDRKESIDRIISMAGGLRGDITSDFFVVSVKQQGESYTVSLNQYYEKNGNKDAFTWTGGDTVFINMLNQDPYNQTVPMVSVIGGVSNPGKVLYRENATLFYYLEKTGGVIPNLGYDEAFLIRKVGDKIIRINFNITDMDTVPDMLAGDVVMLNAEKKSFEDKVWERIVQVGSIITSIAVLIIAL